MITTILEGTTGFALLTKPSIVVFLLFDFPLEDSVSTIISRVAGAALIFLSLVCWIFRKIENSTGFLFSLLFYNLASFIILGYSGLYENLIGIALWPAVIVHGIMTTWAARLLFETRNHH